MTHLVKDLSNINSCLLSYLAQEVFAHFSVWYRTRVFETPVLAFGGPGFVLYKPVSALAAQNMAPCWQNQGHQALVRNAGSQVLPWTY